MDRLRSSGTWHNVAGIRRIGRSRWTKSSIAPAIALILTVSLLFGQSLEDRAKSLIPALQSTVGSVRIGATREIFSLGPSILPVLMRAGGKQISTIETSRLDVIVTLLQGLRAGSYVPNSLGLHLERGTSRADVVEMGKLFHFQLAPATQLNPGATPTCYVTLERGQALPAVMRELLEKETRVITLNLDYVER